MKGIRSWSLPPAGLERFWFNTKSCGDSNQSFSLSSIKHWKRKIGIYQFLYCFLGGGCGGNRSLAFKERFPPQTFALTHKYRTCFHISGAVFKGSFKFWKTQKIRISLNGLIRMDFVTKRYCVYSGILYRSYPLFATFTMMRSSSVMMILE